MSTLSMFLAKEFSIYIICQIYMFSASFFFFFFFKWNVQINSPKLFMIACTQQNVLILVIKYLNVYFDFDKSFRIAVLSSIYGQLLLYWPHPDIDSLFKKRIAIFSRLTNQWFISTFCFKDSKQKLNYHFGKLVVIAIHFDLVFLIVGSLLE